MSTPQGQVLPDTAGTAGSDPTPSSATNGGSDPMSWTASDSVEIPTETQPVPESTPEVAKPEEAGTQPQAASPDAGATEDPFEKIVSPTPVDWRNLRTHKDQILAEKKAVEAQFEAVKPTIEKIEAFGGPEMVSVVEPLFRPLEGATEQEQRLAALTNARELVGNIVKMEPYMLHGLAEALYEIPLRMPDGSEGTYGDQFMNWRLTDKGLSPTDLTAYQTWKTSGQIPPGYAPIAGTFPAPNENGDVVLPDGTPLNVNDDPVHKAMYNLAKGSWEREQADSRVRAEQAEQQRSQAETQARSQRMEADQTFMTARDAAFDAAVGQQAIDFGPDTDIGKQMVIGIARNLMDADQELHSWVEQARNAVGRGAGRANSFAASIDRRGQEHLNKAASEVKALFTRLRTAEETARKGLPKVPTTTTPGMNNGAPPPAPTGGRDQYSNIFTIDDLGIS